MILIRSLSVIQNPEDVLEMKTTEVMATGEAILMGNTKFFIPKDIKDFAMSHADKGMAMALLEAYKVGFLKKTLEYVWPSRKSKEIFEIIRDQYQVFATTRKMQMRFTLYNQTPAIHVPR